MTKYLNFFESESGFTEAVEAGQLFFPNVSYTEDDDTVHWNLTQPADPVETPMLRMHFRTSSPGEGVKLSEGSDYGITAMEIDGTPVNVSGGTYRIAEPGNHTAVYQLSSSKIHDGLFWAESGEFDTFTSVEIISAVTEIGYNAFHQCGGLTGVSMSDSVTYIGTGAFSNCPSLQSVVLSDSLTSIWVGAFQSCTALASIDIPDSVTTIAFQAFAVTGLRSVTIPDSVAYLGPECFARCGDLRSAVIGSGVTTVGEKAFSGCGGLTEIYLNPETPPSLGNNALDYTNDCPIYVPAASVEAYKQAWPSYAYRIKTKHRISASVNDEDKGEVMLGQETASEGDQVNFNVFVFDEEQYQVSSVSVTDGNGNNVQVTDEGDNSYSFTMPDSDVTISVTIEESPKHRISASLNDDSLGVVNVQETASEGDRVDFSVYVFDSDANQITSVTATDGNGDEVRCQLVFDEGDHNRYSFIMPASDVTIFATIEKKQ